ncbi:hypothetical protein DY000_02060105 [Brassica cretica]|uniref:Uncharacterized protein n=1 Tax=Brassica cretica TaxID=69181 RepID=A0ABQ7B4E0_BRACR|nr:hypothetical protein DY000_02060105 [Brassica cretica]
MDELEHDNRTADKPSSINMRRPSMHTARSLLSNLEPSSRIHTTIPSKRKIHVMEPDEYDEDYRDEEINEYRGLALEEARVLKTSHETRGETSIDGNYKPSIDTHPETEPDTYSGAEIDDMVHGIYRA